MYFGKVNPGRPTTIGHDPQITLLFKKFFTFRKLQPRLGDADILSFYQDVPKHQFHFLYANCQRNYLINRVDNLFRGTDATMYIHNTLYVIHPHNKPCSRTIENEPINSGDTTQQRIDNFLRSTYPKQKYLPLLFSILHPHALFNQHLFFNDFVNVHVADFCSFIVNPFGKPGTTDAKFVKVCKYLQAKHIVLPKVAVKNPVAAKFLCG
jgi:hypothetical protein